MRVAHLAYVQPFGCNYMSIINTTIKQKTLIIECPLVCYSVVYSTILILVSSIVDYHHTIDNSVL